MLESLPGINSLPHPCSPCDDYWIQFPFLCTGQRHGHLGPKLTPTSMFMNLRLTSTLPQTSASQEIPWAGCSALPSAQSVHPPRLRQSNFITSFSLNIHHYWNTPPHLTTSFLISHTKPGNNRKRPSPHHQEAKRPSPVALCPGASHTPTVCRSIANAPVTCAPDTDSCPLPRTLYGCLHSPASLVFPSLVDIPIAVQMCSKITLLKKLFHVTFLSRYWRICLLLFITKSFTRVISLLSLLSLFRTLDSITF